MIGLFYRLAFRRGGKPREWLLSILFRNGSVARPLFRRVVYDGEGRVRLRFVYWVDEPRLETDEFADSSKLAQQDSPPLRNENLVRQAMQTFRGTRSLLDRTLEVWRGKLFPIYLLEDEMLFQKLTMVKSSVPRKLVICVSHDDYTKALGGVQLCIQREQVLTNAHGSDYLQIHPIYSKSRLAHIEEDPDTLIALILNGKAIGACRMSTLIELIRKSILPWVKISVVVHHLLGHLPEQVVELVKATGGGRCVFWLHDFFSLCSSHNLQKNDLVFCGAPPAKSDDCRSCLHGSERSTHRKRIQAFFEELRVAVASPSAVTGEFWQDRSDLPIASITILPHMTLDIAPRKQEFGLRDDRPVTVGYIGAPARQKGWPVFVRLMHEHADSGAFRFAVMSTKRPQIGEDVWEPVRVTARTPNAMSDAIAKEDVDIVLHWPNWPETFSFTTFEALTGAAYVVTHPRSGNVARAVEQTGRGAILYDLEELFSFFRDGRAQGLAKHRRVANRSVEIVPRHSEMSLPILWNESPLDS